MQLIRVVGAGRRGGVVGAAERCTADDNGFEYVCASDDSHASVLTACYVEV